MSPPRTVSRVIEDLIYVVICRMFMLESCACFSKAWIDVSGCLVKDIDEQLLEVWYMCICDVVAVGG